MEIFVFDPHSLKLQSPPAHFERFRNADIDSRNDLIQIFNL